MLLDLQQLLAAVFGYLRRPNDIRIPVHGDFAILVRFNVWAVDGIHESLVSPLHMPLAIV